MIQTFENTRAFNRPLNNWDVSNVTDMTSMFASSAFNQPIDNWVVENVTNMSQMFRSASFNQPIGTWNVSAVTNMARMFERNSAFNQPLNNWTVDNVTDMSSMFDGGSGTLSKFNQPLNLWNVSAVTNMSGMFSVTEFNQPIDNWDVSAVTDMNSMFQGWSTYYTHFDQPLASWDVSNVTDMRGMFASSVFNQPINGWTVDKVENMSSMFSQASEFNQPLNSWSVDSVTNMSAMFSKATEFDQDISAWNIVMVSNMTNMLDNSALSQANYDALLTQWSTLNVTDNVNLGARTIQYCDGRIGRQELIDDHNWRFTADQINCDFVLCANIISPVADDQNVPNNFALVWASVNGATGYRVTVKRIDSGGNESLIADNQDFGNVTQIDFIGDFTAGDTVEMTVVPYNATGPATDCQKISVGIINNWRSSPDAYILTYDTRINGIFASNANLLELEINTGFTYDFNIDWGDNQYNNNVSRDITHRYRIPGIYTIAIIGTYPAPYHGVFGDGTKLLTVDQFGTQKWQSMRQAFYRAKDMTFNNPGTPDLSEVTNMYGTFYDTDKFNTNINHWDVSKVTNMGVMFLGSELFNQPLDNWDVSKVTSMTSMFSGTTEFNQPLTSWEVDLVENMSSMFRYTDAFNQPLDAWNTEKVTNMSSMFENSKNFNQNLNSWDVGAVTDMEEMFKGAEAFNGNISGWNVSAATTMEGMFENAKVFNRPIGNWNVGNVRNMINMFKDTDVFNQPINDWDVSKVTNMTRMFQSATAFDQPLNLWQVDNVLNMTQMFNNATAFNQNINPWNVTKVTNMFSMFNSASNYNQSMDSWDVNSVVNMQSMFESAEAFNQPLNVWDVSAVANMSSMFKNAILFNEPLQGWDVSSVTLMNSMFENAAVFNRNLDPWDVGSVTRMDTMFKDAVSFNQLLGSWDTGEVLTMEEMFHGASRFNRSIENWNVSFVSNMEKMFKDALAFDQPLNAWNVASVNTMEDMFNNAIVFNQDIDGWNVRNVTTMKNMFNTATSFNQSIDSWRIAGVSTMEGMFQNANSYNQPMDSWNFGTTNMRSFLQDASAFNQSLAAWDVSPITDMRNMLDNTAIERTNYDNTLIAWSEQTLTSGITLGALTLPYCDGQEERQSMIDTFGWNIVGDVRDCPIPACTQLTSPLNGATDVPVNTNLTWEPTLFAQGYRLTVGTTAGGNDVVNNVTITNETSYEFAADFNTGDVVYVTLIPFNDEGDAVGPCTEESFTISNDPATIPDCTNLTEPLNNATDVLVTTDLSWNAISNADGYRLTVGTSAGGSEIINNEDVGNIITYDFATDLPEDSDIFVTIVPYNDEGDATSCTEESFKTELIPVPPVCTNLISPANASTDVPIDTPLNWTAVSNATGYLVIVGTTSGGIEVVNNIDVGANTTYNFSADLQEDRLHYVTIIPYNDEGDATGCIEETFRTGNSSSPPPCTSLTMPMNSAIGVDPATNLSWTGLTRATGYKLSVGTTSGGTDIYTDDVGNVTMHDLTADLPESTVIFVTVTPYNENGDALGCTEESFTTDGPPLCTTLITPANGATNVAVDTGIEWNASTNADGYKLTVTASSSTVNNETDLDITTGTTHTFTNDFERGETVTITIVPYNSVGDATGPCTSESFTIIPPPVPPCTTLIAPADGATNIARNTDIEWNSVTGADGYKLTVSGSTSTANNLTDYDVTSGTTHSFINNFDQGETVSVTIVPYNDQGDAIGCTAESFTIRPVPACNSLIMPADGAVNVAVDTDMSWTVVSNATGYRLTVVAGSSTANNVTDIDIPTGNTYNFPNDFEQGETVTVTITPYNESGDAIGCSSEGWTIKPVPTCTNLVTPANGATDVAVATDIEWNAIAEATGYKLTVSGSISTANNLTDFDVTTGNTYSFPSNFEQGETVTVTIVPYNEVGDAIGCTSESFSIKPVPLCTNLITPADGSIDVAVDSDISWAAIADATGYKLTVMASSSTANNVIDFDVMTGTSYDFPSDFEQSESVTVTITPYNEVGDAIGCTSESFTIKSVPLCTNLIAPTDGEVVAEVYDISWTEIVDADGYKLTISGSSTTTNNVTDFDFTGTTYVFPNDFTQGEVVTVTITPYNEVGDAIGCTSESFTIRPIPSCTNLVSPIHNATNVSVMSDISWDAAFDADGYRISVGTSANGTDIVNNEDVASLTSYTFGEDLPSETLIYVTVVPYNTSGAAVGCTSDSFETEVIIPECTSLSSPFNGETEVDLESTIVWEEIEKTDGYRLSIGTTPAGTDIVNNQDMGAATSYSHTTEFPFDTQIYVTIISYNLAGDAIQCEEQSFTTLVPEDNTKYGFSPDGDGINEYWHIENIEYYPENVVMIYNRWGDAVFRVDNYDNGQNVFRGEANMKTKMGAGTLPAGTYFFNIQIEGETILKKTKGYVVIKR